MSEITKGARVEYRMGMEGERGSPATVLEVWPNGLFDLEVQGAEGDEPQIVHCVGLGDDSTELPHFRMVD
jgi:hypothetical protein